MPPKIDLNVTLVEKYRPKQFIDIVGNPTIIQDCAAYCDSKQMPHLLLCGVQGTGKTSLAYVILNALYGSNMKTRFIEINASDDSRIEVIRTRVKDFAMHSFPADGVEFRVILLEEADAIPDKSQAALRRMMERYRNCRFILTCNYKWKIILPIQSRCACFEFQQITPEQMLPRIQYICNEEKIQIEPEALKFIAEKSKGDIRTAINSYIERMKNMKKLITIGMLQHFQIDNSGILTIIKHALNKRLNPALQSYLLLAQKGLQVREFINKFCEVCKEQPYPDLMKAEIMILGLEAEQALINGSQDERVIDYIIGKFCLLGVKHKKTP